MTVQVEIWNTGKSFLGRERAEHGCGKIFQAEGTDKQWLREQNKSLDITEPGVGVESMEDDEIKRVDWSKFPEDSVGHIKEFESMPAVMKTLSRLNTGSNQEGAVVQYDHSGSTGKNGS